MTKDWVQEAADRAEKELDELEAIDPVLRRKLEAEARKGRNRMTADERADDPRRGQGK
jgi:hypothetical protein